MKRIFRGLLLFSISCSPNLAPPADQKIATVELALLNWNGEGGSEQLSDVQSIQFENSAAAFQAESSGLTYRESAQFADHGVAFGHISGDRLHYAEFTTAVAEGRYYFSDAPAAPLIFFATDRKHLQEFVALLQPKVSPLSIGILDIGPGASLRKIAVSAAAFPAFLDNARAYGMTIRPEDFKKLEQRHEPSGSAALNLARLSPLRARPPLDHTNGAAPGGSWSGNGQPLSGSDDDGFPPGGMRGGGRGLSGNGRPLSGSDDDGFPPGGIGSDSRVSGSSGLLRARPRPASPPPRIAAGGPQSADASAPPLPDPKPVRALAVAPAAASEFDRLSFVPERQAGGGVTGAVYFGKLAGRTSVAKVGVPPPEVDMMVKLDGLKLGVPVIASSRTGTVVMPEAWGDGQRAIDQPNFNFQDFAAKTTRLVAGMHANGMRWNDAKPENFLYVEGDYRISDLGTARYRAQTQPGDFDYPSSDPAFLDPGVTGRTVTPTQRDVYAMGLTLASAASRRKAPSAALLRGADGTGRGKYAEASQAFQVELRSDLQKYSGDRNAALISRMIGPPAYRPTMDEVARHFNP